MRRLTREGFEDALHKGQGRVHLHLAAHGDQGVEDVLLAARAGVFFGCAPDDHSEFWIGAWTLQEGYCDLAVRDQPDLVYYCFKGRQAVHWRSKHPEAFCSTTPCEGEIVDDCVGP